MTKNDIKTAVAAIKSGDRQTAIKTIHRNHSGMLRPVAETLGHHMWSAFVGRYVSKITVKEAVGDRPAWRKKAEGRVIWEGTVNSRPSMDTVADFVDAMLKTNAR